MKDPNEDDNDDAALPNDEMEKDTDNKQEDSQNILYKGLPK